MAQIRQHDHQRSNVMAILSFASAHDCQVLTDDDLMPQQADPAGVTARLLARRASRFPTDCAQAQAILLS